MAHPLIIFGDIEATVIALLKDQEIVAHQSIPADRPDSFVVVQRIGGRQADLVSEVATIDVEAWAPTPKLASALLQRVRAIIRHQTLPTVGKFLSVDEDQLPAFDPDPASTTPVYSMVLSIRWRATSGA